MNFYNGSGIPPSPIGNTAMAQQPLPYIPIGGNPYTPYSGQGAYGYYNPWEMQRRQEEEFRNYNKQTEAQIDFAKAIIIGANRDLGRQIDEAELDKQFEEMRPQYKTSSDYFKAQSDARAEQALQQAVQNTLNCMPKTRADLYAEYIDKKADEMADRYADCKTVEEEYQRFTEICFDMEMEKLKRENRNLSNRYNGNDYRSLINQSSGNSNFSNIYTPNIDDYEVTLPSSLQNIYMEKRARFLSKVMGGY